MNRKGNHTRPPLWSIALLSATALAYEVLLTRLFSIIQWHHFSYMVISLALLGYGASGSFLSGWQNRIERHFFGLFIANALLFAFSTLISFLITQRIPFNPLEIGWNPGQFWYLLALYLLLAIPFLCVANCFGLAFMRYREHIHRIYAFDLIGAGGGALGIILLLFAVFPMTALLILAVTALLTTLLALWECRLPYRWGIAILAGAVTIGWFMPPSWLTLHLSPYKGLSQALQVEGAKKIIERSSPLGLVTVVRNDEIPFRYAPGLSLAAPQGPPPQLGLFNDGNESGAITRFSGRWQALDYLDYLTSALPYHLLQKPQVLVLGAGGGSEVLQALYYQASSVDAVELNPQMIELVRKDFAEFAGDLYNRPQVQVHSEEARGFVAGSDKRFDLIQVALLDAFSTSSAGLYALSESYLYTVEALEHYLNHLKPGGMLSITRWLRLPPKDTLKIWATAVTALERLGIADPGVHLALIRGWKTSTLIVKNGPLEPKEINVLRQFCQRRSFDLAWYPGITAQTTNRFNVLEQPYLYQAAKALLGPNRNDFLDRYKFNVAPATDDRPYFFQFFKWRTLPELLSLQARSGLGQLEWGYLVLVATLVQALLAGIALILLPLWLSRRYAPAQKTPSQTYVPSVGTGVSDRWRVLSYFLSIGLGFLFLEMAFIQKFILFLSHPLYAVAVVLCAFLVFAGLGSGYCERLDFASWQPSALIRVVAAMTGLTLIYLALLPVFFHWALPWPDSLKILSSVILIAPLAFCMGMPFPLGLTRVARANPQWLPWAWAINGCASVVSAVLATVLAVHLGFSGVVMSALALYLTAALTAPRPVATEPGSADFTDDD